MAATAKPLQSHAGARLASALWPTQGLLSLLLRSEARRHCSSPTGTHRPHPQVTHAGHSHRYTQVTPAGHRCTPEAWEHPAARESRGGTWKPAVRGAPLPSHPVTRLEETEARGGGAFR